MKKKKFLFALMLAAAFIYGLALAGCEQEADTGDVGGEGGHSDEIKNLPNFSGTFVENEAEAMELSAGADAQIQSVLSVAMSEITGQIGAEGQNSLSLYNGIDLNNFIPLFQRTTTGTIDSNGIHAEYTVTTPDGDTALPGETNFTMIMTGTINETYDGYEIKGKFDAETEIVTEYSNDTRVVNIKATDNISYSVSYEGKGMKIVSKVNMEISGTVTSQAITGTCKYSVYDNDGVLRFDNDYIIMNYPMDKISVFEPVGNEKGRDK